MSAILRAVKAAEEADSQDSRRASLSVAQALPKYFEVEGIPVALGVTQGPCAAAWASAWEVSPPRKFDPECVCRNGTPITTARFIELVDQAADARVGRPYEPRAGESEFKALSRQTGQAFADNLNRHVRARIEADQKAEAMQPLTRCTPTVESPEKSMKDLELVAHGDWLVAHKLANLRKIGAAPKAVPVGSDDPLVQKFIESLRKEALKQK